MIFHPQMIALFVFFLKYKKSIEKYAIAKKKRHVCSFEGKLLVC